jgi:hypothetical protein
MEKITVLSSAHDGYRRGGQSFVPGQNHFALSLFNAAQLQQLATDPRLVVLPPSNFNASNDADGAASITAMTDATGPVLASLETFAPIETLEQAFSLLLPDNPDHFTNNGLPQIPALKLMLKRDISAAERNDAWEAFKTKSQAGAE